MYRCNKAKFQHARLNYAKTAQWACILNEYTGMGLPPKGVGNFLDQTKTTTTAMLTGITSA
jgi:hypothetical protein